MTEITVDDVKRLHAEWEKCAYDAIERPRIFEYGPAMAALCIAQSEEIERKSFQLINAKQSTVDLMMKVELLESLLRQHHEDREGHDSYYDSDYDLFNETVEAIAE